MKVLFYSHTGKVSGAEFILLTILENIDRSKIEPVAVCPLEGGLSDRLRAMDVPVSSVPELGARFTLRPDRLLAYGLSCLRIARELRTAVVRQRPDAIHANSIRAGLVAYLATAGLGLSVTWHLQDELPVHPVSTLIRIIALSSGRNRFMAASAATLKSFRGRLLPVFGSRSEAAVVHNGVDVSRFANDGEGGEKMREELGIPREEMVFGMIGQITPRKGQAALVEAFAAVQGEMPGARLLIAGRPMFNGDAEYLEEVKARVAWYGLEDKVTFLGQRSDIPDVLKAIDALVINSKSEALVVVAIEAMASGTPVIATDVGGTRELVTHLKDGWLIPYGDLEALEESLVRVGSDPALRISLAREASRTVRKGFSSQKLAADAERFLLASVAEAPDQQASVAVGVRYAEGK
jgi:glycosyltransferase involved in cell wall biosynthesis